MDTAKRIQILDETAFPQYSNTLKYDSNLSPSSYR